MYSCFLLVASTVLGVLLALLLALLVVSLWLVLLAFILNGIDAFDFPLAPVLCSW